MGKNFGEIAELIGAGSPQSAYNAYKAALEWVKTTETIEDIIETEAARLDDYILALKADGSARAIEVLVKVAERKARLLGLDAPEKKLIKGQFEVESRITEVTPDFLAATIRELNQTNPRALDAHHAEPVDSAQANTKASRVSARASA